MAASYSDDLRIRVIEAARKLGSVNKAALAFSLSRLTTIKWVQADRDEGSQRAKPDRGHPPELPAHNPIEQEISKIKAHMRKAAARSFDAICENLGRIIDTFTHQECKNFLSNSGYA